MRRRPLSSLLVPVEFWEKIGAGTAKTSRLYWVAKSAVISVPLFSAASITKRRGHSGDNSVAGRKSMHTGGHFPVHFGDKTATAFQYFFGKIYIGAGVHNFVVQAGTRMAIVFSPLFNAALWAMPSMPMTSPLTMTNCRVLLFNRRLFFAGFFAVSGESSGANYREIYGVVQRKLAFHI